MFLLVFDECFRDVGQVDKFIDRETFLSVANGDDNDVTSPDEVVILFTSVRPENAFDEMEFTTDDAEIQCRSLYGTDVDDRTVIFTHGHPCRMNCLWYPMLNGGRQGNKKKPATNKALPGSQEDGTVSGEIKLLTELLDVWANRFQVDAKQARDDRVLWFSDTGGMGLIADRAEDSLLYRCDRRHHD